MRRNLLVGPLLALVAAACVLLGHDALQTGSVFRPVMLAVIALAAMSATLGGALVRAGRLARNPYLLAPAMASAMADAVWIVDPDEVVAHVNPAAVTLLGWTERDVSGRPLSQVLIERPSISHLCGGGRPGNPGEPAARSTELSIARKNGPPLAVNVTASPLLRHGRAAGTLLIIRERSSSTISLRLAHNRSHYRDLLRITPDPIWITDLYGYVLVANEPAAQLFGYATPEALAGRSALELLRPNERHRAVGHKWQTIKEGSVAGVEYDALRPDGTVVRIECNLSLVSDVEEPTAILALAREVAVAREEMEPSLPVHGPGAWQAVAAAVAPVFAECTTIAEVRPRLLEAVGASSGWDLGLFWEVDEEELVLHCDAVWRRSSVEAPAFEILCRQMLCTPEMDLPGRAFARRGAVWVDDILCDPGMPRALVAAKDGLRSALCVPVIVRGSVCGVLEFLGGTVRAVDEELVEQIRAVANLYARFSDLTRTQRTLEHQALHDALTDLPNRKLLQRRMVQALGAAREYGKSLSLLGIDLDGFKGVNDRYGHHYGDVLLQQVALRLKAALRESDTVARVGGDEFSILLPGADEHAAVTVAHKVHTALREPFLVDGRRLEIGGSIGIAVYPDHGVDIDVLVHRADSAMYLAKRTGGGYTVYPWEHGRPELAAQPC